MNAFNALCKSIEHNVWFRVLLIAVTVLLLVSAHNKMQKCKIPTPHSGVGLGYDTFMEGFAQNNVIVKKDADTKDAFYAAVQSNQKANQSHAYEVGAIIDKYPDISNEPVVLDVGAGTGAYMSAFIQHGITDITGIEPSAKMIAQAKKNYPTLGLNIVKGNPTTASAFKPDSFTLVSMMNFEVYYIPNTEQLFTNVYDWLKPGGYFVLHLVDPSKIRAESMMVAPSSESNDRTKARSVATFHEFEHKSDVQMFPNDMVQHTEVFTHEKTGKVRKYVRNFKIPSPHSFIEIATGVGFNMLGQIDLVKAQKEHQYFYLLHKPAN